MIYPQIVAYIKDSLSKKIPLDQIKKSLIANGWRESDINEAIALNNQSFEPATTPSQAINNKPNKTIPPKIIFIVLGIFSFLLILSLVIFLLVKGSNQISDTEVLQGAVVNLGLNKEVKFNIEEESHRLVVDSIREDSADITIYSSPIITTLSVGQEQKFDLNSDNSYDLLVRLNSITNQKADIYVQEINEAICVEEWECTDWGICVNSTQSRTCTDANSCGMEDSKPSEIQVCVVEVVVANLTCSEKNGTVCEIYEECNGTLEENCCLGNCTRIETTACGTNITCLIDASEICHPANLTYGVYSGNSTIENTTYYYSIEGFEDEAMERCEFYAAVQNVEGNFTSTQWTELLAVYTTVQINEMLYTIHSDLIGDYVNCIFSTSDLEDYLIEVQNGRYVLTAADLVEYECTGDLY